MNKVLRKIQMMGIVPVIKIDDPKDAKPLAKALIDGGLPCAEVTFRTKAAKESIRIMRDAYPHMLIGAGTVLTTEQVDDAVAAGATFIVSPGLNPKVVEYCVGKNITIIPGCSSPSDVEAALQLGLEVVKFFPAEAAGGLPMIKAMAAPYTNMKFLPTGGVNANNLVSYLDFPKIIACGGSWMVKDSYIKAGEFHKITDLTKEAVELMLGLEIAHIGINAEGDIEAEKVAKLLQSFEVIKKPSYGEKGHIGIGTNNIKRAIYHLEAKGYTFNKESIMYDDDNNLKRIYLNDEFAGFAIHLLQR